MTMTMKVSEILKTHGIPMYAACARACLPDGRVLRSHPGRGLCLVSYGPTVESVWTADPHVDQPNTHGLREAAYIRLCQAATKRWVQAQAAEHGWSLRLQDIELD
jgi:hypothetical protein